MPTTTDYTTIAVQVVVQSVQIWICQFGKCCSNQTTRRNRSQAWLPRAWGIRKKLNEPSRAMAKALCWHLAWGRSLCRGKELWVMTGDVQI